MTKLICAICGSPVTRTLFGLVGIGVCRDEMNPNWDDEGQHVAVEVAA